MTLKSKQQVFFLLASSAFALAFFSTQVEQTSAFDPLVDTGVSTLAADGKHVGVNVPGFFYMVLDTRGPEKGLRMTQSVLSGLVKIFIDRERGIDDKMHGPIQVSVGGLTMYDNKESAPTPITTP